MTRLGRTGRQLAGVLLIPVATMGTAPTLTASTPPATDCIIAIEPNDEAPDAQNLPATESCVTAEHDNGTQDVFNWTIGEAEAGRRWTIAVSSVPGQAVTLQVYRVELDDAGTVLSAEKLAGADGGPGEGAALSDLLWPAGEYVVGVGTSGPGPYELTITPGAETPPAADNEPNDSLDQAAAFAGAFAVSGDRAGSQDWFAWDLDEAAADQRWQLSFRLPVLSAGNIHVMREDGTELLNGAVNALGTFTLPDIGLDAGRYLLFVDNAGEPPAPYIIEATSQGPPAEGQETEPNDRFESALPVSPVVGATTMSGRLATAGADTDYDVYRLVVDGDAAGRQIDVKLFWQGGNTRRLCLNDAEGNPLQCGENDRAVAFNDVVLAAGEYGIQVSGPSDPDDPYLLRLDATEVATPGFEAEPNDTMARATPLDVTGENPVGSGRLTAQGAAPDSDVFRFTVSGEPQLWQVTASGPGVTKVDVLDATGSASMSADAADGSATLYDAFLLPGDRAFRVSGDGSDYTIEAVPLGPPDPQFEHEPNNSFDYSQPIRLGETRFGRLVQPNDSDVYRFSLQNEGHVVVRVDVAPDAIVQMDLQRPGTTILSMATAEAGDDIAYDAVLPPGDYSLWLSPRTPSVEPYEITIDPRDPFTTADDAEPNDVTADAVPMPADLTVSGLLDPTYRYGDTDWFVLPALDSPGTATFEVTGDGASIQLVTPATVDTPETPIAFVEDADGTSYTADLPASTPVLLGVTGTGDYTVAVTPSGGANGVRAAELPVDVDLSACDQPVAAYWIDSQRVECDVVLTNTSDDAVDVTLDAATGHYAWAVEFGEPSVSIDPGDTANVPITVVAAPDAWADQLVLVTVRASNSDGASTGSLAIAPSRDALPAHSAPYDPLPPELLGGLDVAWTGLGAVPVAADVTALAAESLLYDQLSPVGTGWTGDPTMLPVELTTDLAGDDVVPVAGITLNPQGAAGEQLRGFDLELSLDGQTFTPALSGELSTIPVDQAFTLPEPVDARFARLRVRSAQSAAAQTVSFTEWAVIAQPGWVLPAGEAGINIADPNVGGHVVAMEPSTIDYAFWNGVIVKDPTIQSVYPEGGGTQSWVIGFHHDRAAQITHLAWTDPPGSNPAARFDEVTVEVSVDSPTGPWLPAGTWPLDRSAGSARFAFADPTWARFVRISGPLTPADPNIAREFPDVIEVYESQANDSYRSILGEWGHDRREAIYEHLAPAEPITLDPDAGNDADAATPLALASSVTDTAWVSQDEDWYVVDVPDDQHALEVTLSGVPTIDVDVALFDGDGDEIALESDEPSATEVTFNAVVPTGGEYFVRVTEPPSSVVFGFDTSMSIGPYTPAVLQGLVRYSGDVEQGQESVNIVPFGAEMLLDEWTDEPYLLQAAITNYPQSASSSDAEGALVMSMDELASQPGVKAVVLITDAQNAVNPDLWSRLGAVQPRIFAVHLAGGTPLDQDLMEDWAAVNNGLYTYVHNQGEIDVAFDRAATILRRPSVYSLHVEATEPPPPPTTTTTSTPSTTPSTTVAPTTVPVDGFVRVLPSPLQQGQPVAVGGNASVAIILDTSGSMLQDIDGVDRIDAARGALTTLLTETIPAGTNVSLRVFGATPDSCDTVLVVPQSPLDPAAMAGVIQNVPVVDGVKTPIGASLTQVANDLGTAPGRKIVVLVTDGEETCGGDAAAAIQALIDSGIDVHVNIVGFALDDEALKAQFQEWAQLGNGQYIDAGNQAELTAAVAAAVQPTFDIVDANGAVIVSGQVGGDPVAVPAGTYVLEVRSEPPQRFDITVVGTQTLELPLP